MGMSQLSHEDGVALPMTTWWKENYRDRTDTASHCVTVFVRSFAPAPGQHDTRAALLDGLQSVVQSGLVESYGSTVLGEQICRCQSCQNTPEATRLLDIAARLANWESAGLRATGFDERTARSVITGEEYRVIVPPELAIGIYDDDSLVGVFPNTSSTERFRPNDYVKTLLDNHGDKATEAVRELS